VYQLPAAIITAITRATMAPIIPLLIWSLQAWTVFLGSRTAPSQYLWSLTEMM
jgi:hypothetical protein